MNPIRKIRERLHLTQQQLAERLKVTRVTVVRWETGIHTPHQSFMAKLKELR